jgi:hypothetical protein
MDKFPFVKEVSSNICNHNLHITLGYRHMSAQEANIRINERHNKFLILL